ncbi:TIGR03915 family putative DNA repair protein [Hufsiella ginkgonis]|uniref:DUF4130 domain-containing protein n=1 Tax=Hufsiella ginkgonis TaxID=2695274 RepID=A0A7K1Y3A4_9SPHI|nr:TIGR03915 family putative DNA repair protein [Hufsiella ginkgonis]MXV17357.1 DUF4130 domain-containing protein [Hufsiella ginkgonis]
MIILLYDHTWPGMLSAIFEAFDRKLTNCMIRRARAHMPSAFDQDIEVTTNTMKAARVITGLKKKLSADGFHQFYACFLSELHGIEDTLFAYTRLIFSSKDRVEQAFANAAVLRVSQVAKSVHREKHRMEAFVRFRLASDSLFFAEVEPDFNVLPLILNHFEKRYADQRWLIYDMKRNYGIYYDLEKVTEVTLQRTVGVKETAGIFHEEEPLYESLWNDYFKHVNIRERKNTKLHLQHVPRRYWKHLTEKNKL